MGTSKSYNFYDKYSDQECWNLLNQYLKEVEKFESIEAVNELQAYQVATSLFNLKHRVLKLKHRLKLISTGQGYVAQLRELERELTQELKKTRNIPGEYR